MENLFDKYLEEQFMKEEGHMFLDDDLPDALDAWISNLDVSEILAYGNKAMVECKPLGLD